jgi:hypothetical protein
MFFKISYEVLGLREHLQDFADLGFHFSSPISATVRRSSRRSDGQEPPDPSIVICVGTTAGEIDDVNWAAEIHRALSKPPLNGGWADFSGMDASRTPLLFGALDPFFDRLRSLMKSTVAVLRWRSGLSEGPNDPFRSWREHISLDGEAWLEFGTVRGFRITQVVPPRQIAVSTQLKVT